MKNKFFFLWVLLSIIAIGAISVIFSYIFLYSPESQLQENNQKVLSDSEPLLSLPTSTMSEATSTDEIVTVPSPDTLTSTFTPQFVVLAFDGSYSLKKWQDTLDFAAEMKAVGKPIHYTYFLSGVYFLNQTYRHLYMPPHQPTGSSAIGFALNNNDVKRRVAMVNRALEEGHEIGSHLNGHYTGSKWLVDDWRQEFDFFHTLLFSIAQNNHATSSLEYQINLEAAQLVGLRAPELGYNPALFDVLKEKNYRYDTSLTGKSDAWPYQLKNGIWEFPVAQIQYAHQKSSILSMDYNFYYKQSQAKDIAKKGSAEWNKFYEETYISYINYFNKNYTGTRAPVYIASHFSDWNDGVYWEAMKGFAREVCSKPEVQCVSYRELMEYMENRDDLSTE